MDGTRTRASRFVAAIPFVVGLAFAGPAAAAIPPISEADLEARSELVIDARVTAVACAPPVDISLATGVITERPYISTLEVLTTHKGEATTPLSYRGFGLDTPPNWVGAQPSRPLPVGWVGKLHLKSRGAGLYEQTYTGNEVVEDKARSQPQPLPKCPSVIVPPDDAGGAESSGDQGGCSFGRGAAPPAARFALVTILLALVALRRPRRC